MKVEDLADDIIAFELQREPEMSGELQTVLDIATDRSDCHFVLNFEKVDIVTSPSMSKLLKLRQILQDSNHRLVLCNVNPFTKGAFMITGLDGIFELMPDKRTSLAILRHGGLRNSQVGN